MKPHFLTNLLRVFECRKLFLYFMALLALIPSLALGKEPVSWEQDKARFEKQIFPKGNEEKKCQAAWNLLWPWARKGNLEARALLLMDAYTNGRIMPGRNRDWITVSRDMMILAVHSAGVEGETYNKILDEQYKTEFAKSVFSKGSDLNCFVQSRSQDCTKTAVAHHVVPSFKQYADEIDLLIKAGKRSVCLGTMGDKYREGAN